MVYFYTASCTWPWTWTPTGLLCTPANHILVILTTVSDFKHTRTIIKQNFTLTTRINVLSVILPHLNIHLSMCFRPTWYICKLTQCLLQEYVHTDRNTYGCLSVLIKYIPCIDFKFGILNLKFSCLLWFYVNTMWSHNVCTHWMYLPVVNIGLKMVL